MKESNKILSNAAISLAIALAVYLTGYYMHIKPSLDLARENYNLSVPAEVVVIVRPAPRNDVDNSRNLSRIYVANIGKIAVENVNMRFGLYLVTDSAVYTYYSVSSKPQAYFIDTTRSASEMEWPRLTLQPDDRQDFTDRMMSSTSSGYNSFIPENYEVINKDMFSISYQFKGRYVLFVEYSYRPSGGRKKESDIAYFWFRSDDCAYQEMRSTAGGPRFMNRLNTYLWGGPDITIKIEKDNYVLYSIGATDKSHSKPIAIKPRKIVSDPK